MRPRPILWFVICLICLAGARYFWQLGDRREEQRRATVAAQATNESGASPVDNTSTNAAAVPTTSQTQPVAAVSSSQAVAPNPGGTNHLDYRVTNTMRTSSQLLRNDRALLLENALLETGGRVTLSIPDTLRARADSGTYIVQADQPLDNAFRALLKDAGAEIVSFIPNNAYLVRMPSSSVAQVESSAMTHAVMDYEPYYKLKWPLLKVAADGTDLPEGAQLNLLLFADAKEKTLAELEQLGAKVLGEDRSIFLVNPRSSSLADIAALPGVQIVELNRKRAPANDLSRARVGVAINSIIQTNILGLTGAGVVVDVNDTGVDATHPDLVGRVFGDLPSSLVDTEGHGTHVAATIAGDGMASTTVTNASGSVMPGVDGQFRGMAPGASIYSVAFADDFAVGPFRPDRYLQEQAANTNALISNNSWVFIGDYSYDLGAAAYDAAVRDSLPEKTGSQPVLYVFAAGNDADGNESGTGGFPGSVNSPATAKNVIAVGALEQLRDITNRVVIGEDTNGIAIWQNRTDSDDQVARYSGRGNVGIGIEGDFGRFKPDVVAPGSFVLSARSAQWDETAYYNSTNHHINVRPFEFVEPGLFQRYSIFVPANAVQLTIRLEPNVLSPDPFPDLPIYMAEGSIPTLADFVAFNEVSLPPDRALVTDTTWFYTIGNNTAQDVTFHIFTDIITTNDFGNYYDVLKNMNDSLGSVDEQGKYPYRYESGTSMSTPVVSGTLALMQEFFQQRLSMTPSPALLKALLINGAIRVNNIYNYAVRANVNDEGWGLVYLPNSLMDGSNALAAAESALKFYDQSPTESLATGESRTWLIEVPVDSQGSPMRFTLVWTDPPGNPVAGVKLVNDLDLVVTNLDTGDVFFGNDFTGDVIVYPWETNSIPNIDSVNNVENVYLSSGLDAHYSVTVIGHRVNVNAVTADPDNTAQDFALVISCGDADNYGPSPVIVDSAQPIQTITQPLVTTLTNTFGSETDVGSMLLGQHVGASSPLLGLETVPSPPTSPGTITLGQTNQWHFYVLTNTTEFTNAAFVTFLPPNLAIPRMGVFSELPGDDSRIQADIDLYVSTNSSLTNLNPDVLATCEKSLTRGGTEFIVYSNSVKDQVYYVGVKSEDQMVAEYGFLGVFSLEPFSIDENGNTIVRGIPIPSVIPDGSNPDPGIAYVLGISLASSPVRRVIVTNTITHDNLGDLFVKVLHDNQSAVLLNHQAKPINNPQAPGPYHFVFEDNGEGDPDDYDRSDGPGTLRNFVGTGGVGVWIYAALDDAPGNTGTVDRLTFRLEPQNTDGDSEIGLDANSFYFDFIDVPPEATNLTVCISQNTGTLELFLLRDDFATTNGFLKSVIVPEGEGGCLSLSIYDIPPLTAGRYFIAVFNPNDDPVNFYLTAEAQSSIIPATPLTYDLPGDNPILDDAVTYSSITVTNDARIARTEVGLRIDHERASDLAITLVSPLGKRILLVENRGNTNTAGFGSTFYATNTVVAAAQTNNPATVINVVPLAGNSGTLRLDYSTFSIADSIDVYYDSADFSVPGNVYSSGGAVSVTNEVVTRNFGPGIATNLTIVVNRVGNTNAGTSWEYTATVFTASYQYLMLTDNTNRTTTPIKFGVPPYIGGGSTTSIQFYTNDFQGAVDPEWSSTGTEATPADLTRRFLGQFLNNPVTLTLTNLPAHIGVTLDFNLFTIRSWDGNGNGTVAFNADIWELGMSGLASPLLRTTFSVPESLPQAYPDSYPGGVNPPYTGAVEVNTLGYYHPTFADIPESAVYRIQYTVPHSTSTVQFSFSASGLQSLADESWGLDNVSVNLTPPPAQSYYRPEESLDVLIGDNAFGEWKLELWDNRAGAYVQGSTFVNWSLFFVFESTEPEITALAPCTPLTNTIPAATIRYYSVDVPTSATSASNILVSADLPVNMLFNQFGPLTGAGVEDFTFLTNSTGGSYTMLVGGTPPLLPGQTYYLGIQNTNLTNVTVTLQVCFGDGAVSNICFPAFPGAEGAGACAVGGRGGDVYYVTNLNDFGPGSLRYGVTNATGPRTILFNVSGTITLMSNLKIDKSFLTIAGQTAPGGGITTRGRQVFVQNANDVIVRYMRFRPGDIDCPSFQGDSFWMDYVQNSIADHVSASWSVDETLSVTASTNVTVQWSMITESLNCSCHDDGSGGTECHGYGSTLRYGSGSLSFHHNLYADHDRASPRLGDNLSLDFVNNVIFNWGAQPGFSDTDATDGPDNPNGFTNRMNYVANYAIAGTNSLAPAIAFEGGTFSTWIYQEGNKIDSDLNGVLNGANTDFAMFQAPYTPNLTNRFDYLPLVTTYTADEAYERVMAFVGTSLALRDTVDLRIASDVRNQMGALIDSQSDVGGWPPLASTTPPLDTDQDGIPDYWEITFGLNPTNASNNLDRDGDGYTDLEEYINWLAVPHALTTIDIPVNVNLAVIAGGTGNLTFGVINGANGVVTLLADGHTAQFVPAAGYSGYASFGFIVTNVVTGQSFGPDPVSVVISAVPTDNIPPIDIIDISVVTNSLCITWSSVVGQIYYVEGSTNLASTNWVAVSPTIVATNTLTTYCVPIVLPYQFFRVVTGVSPISPPSTNIPPNTIIDFVINVPTNATSATNILVFASSPVNMLFNQTNTPTGTNAGDYTFLTNSIGGSYLLLPGGTPPLVPGQTYHLGIQNTNAGPVTVAVQVNFGFEPVTNLPPVIVIDVSIVTNSLCLTWSSVAGQSYYVEGLANLGTTNWAAVSPTIVATTNVTTYCVPLPSVYSFFRVIAGVSPITPPGIPPGMIQDFVINVPTNATSATNILVFADGPVNMFFNQTGPPTGTNVGDFNFLTSSIGGNYLLLPGGTPPLVPGQAYHLGIQNLNTSNVNVTIQVDFGYEPVIPTNPPVVVIDVSIVTNSLCLTWASVAGQSYFVEGLANLGTTNWTAVSPTVVATNSQTTYCVPLPSTNNFFRVIAGVSPITPPVTPPATNPPVVINVFIQTNSLCQTWISVPGQSYYVQGLADLGTTNWTAVSPTIVATTNLTTYCVPLPSTNNFFRVIAEVSPVTPPVTNPPVVVVGASIVTNSFCLTWSSVAAQSYFVEGLANLGATNWAAVSPTIVATNSQTSYCVPLPSAYNFFRVVTGSSSLSTITYDFSSVVPGPGGLTLTWFAPTNLQFNILYTINIALPVSSWSTVAYTFTSTNGTFTFTDDGSLTGGSGGLKFYRLTQLP